LSAVRHQLGPRPRMGPLHGPAQQDPAGNGNEHRPDGIGEVAGRAQRQQDPLVEGARAAFGDLARQLANVNSAAAAAAMMVTSVTRSMRTTWAANSPSR